MPLQCMMIVRLGVIKPLETRKFIVVSRQYLGSTESEIIALWKEVMVSVWIKRKMLSGAEWGGKVHG